MEYYALVEEWKSESMVLFRELPGCLTTAPTYEEALQKAPAAIAEYLLWLKQHDLPLPQGDIEDIKVVVRERIQAKNVGPRFESDLPAPTDEEIEKVFQVANTARTQLVKLYESVAPDLRSKSPGPGEWSLSEHLRHLIECEAYYVMCLNEKEPPTTPDVADTVLVHTFLENGANYERLLCGFTEEQRSHIYIQGGGEWTMAKTFRRMTEHLREHYPWMQDITQRVSSVK
ncbi:type II toxin-antitoxin system HicB family antitoxin [Ktedonospora formicarum]|uniref:DinB-like domain-containing protein n=1 Tax=Ktedonospora formicarum TaxID=2778364 RepID=A0A8J3MU29_9CHLR|nr:type II toxin-antitoxin system HicB family antitoxin [Ktedonospora formicarum]GHO46526.1 hypothetical protein KSX_46890 [Ktedonospora formicarum]